MFILVSVQLKARLIYNTLGEMKFLQWFLLQYFEPKMTKLKSFWLTCNYKQALIFSAISGSLDPFPSSPQIQTQRWT